MTEKVAFFYCCGTSSMTAEFAAASSFAYNAPTEPNAANFAVIPGLNNITALWNGKASYDPFPLLLDPDIFEPRKKIVYKASSTGLTNNLVVRTMGQSINDGISQVLAEITALPAGQKFCLGGYSQGAAVMSGIYLLGLKTGTTGPLESYRDRFLGFVGFGNPRRATNYRGSVGGTWSGAWDIPGSTTGGHGSFPATGPYARLSNPDPLKWIDFAHVDDVITATGNSVTGEGWTAGNNVFLGAANALEWATSIFALPVVVRSFLSAMDLAAKKITGIVDAVGKPFAVPGMGHVTYPLVPPPGNPDNGLTSYQIAVKFLTAKANEYAVAPILLPSQPATSTSAGWSTTLTPPA